MKTNTLQEKLNKSAENKLTKDITEFLEMLQNNSFWAAISSDVKIFLGPEESGGSATKDARAYFWPQTNAEVFQMLFKKLKDQYINQETNEFMSKIEESHQAMQDINYKSES